MGTPVWGEKQEEDEREMRLPTSAQAKRETQEEGTPRHFL